MRAGSVVFLALYAAWLFAVVPALKGAPHRPPAWAVELAASDPARWCFPGAVTEASMRDCGRQIYESFLMGLMWLPAPLAFLIGCGLIVGTQFGLGLVILRTSSVLWRSVHRGFDVLKANRSLWLLPAAGAGSVAALLGVVLWRVLSDPAVVDAGRYDIVGGAVAVVFAPAIFGAYLLSALLMMFANAALIEAYLVDASGEEPAFGRSLGALFRVIPAVTTLTFAVFAALAGVWFGVYSIARRGIVAGTLARFGALVMESGLLITTQMVVAAMLRDKLGFGEAVNRVAGMIRPQGREILTAAFGIATMRHEACLAALAGPIGAAFYMFPIAVGWEIGLGSLMGVGFVAGIGCCAAYAAVVMALEGVLAAGIYVYGSEKRVLKGFDAAELDAFLNGLQQRSLAGRP